MTLRLLAVPGLLLVLTIMPPASEVQADTGSFVTTWRTTEPGEFITIKVDGATGAYTVDWGDGNTTTRAGDARHAYAFAGTYTVTISGDFTRIRLGYSVSNAAKLRSIEQWGNMQWSTMKSAFHYASNMVYRATDVPDLSRVTDMSSMFRDAKAFNGDLSAWDVSSVTDMSFMFDNAKAFNGDLSTWDVSSVTDMAHMLSRTDFFNGDLSAWDVSSVRDMHGLFSMADRFNGDLSAWDVSSVTDMHSMFVRATRFNGDLSAWDVSSVTNMSNVFSQTDFFNGDLSAWDVSSVTDMSWMFHDAKAFNGDLSLWDVSSVTDMSRMFALTETFNGDLSAWDVSSVTDMSYMFRDAKAFNGDLSVWDVSSVTDMEYMFYKASSFNGDLSAWDVSSVTDMSFMFHDAKAFNGDLSVWDVSSVTDMEYMFRDAKTFSGDLSLWDVSSVTDMSSMFRNAKAFNGDPSAWDVSSVTDMSYMFHDAKAFNGDLSAWDVSSVTGMSFMFRNAKAFNGDLSAWDVSSVTDMEYMFYKASSFNGDLSAWDVSSVTDMNRMFDDAKAFDQNLGNWYVVLDDLLVDAADADWTVGGISAQNAFLAAQGPVYRVSPGGDSDSFEIVGGSTLKLKTPTSDLPAKASYAVTITSAGGFGTANSRTFHIGVTGIANNTVVLEPNGPLGPRDIGRITLNGATPGTIHATWEEPDTDPANYRVSWAKTGENFLTFTDLSGNAFPTEPSYTITNLEEGGQYKVKILASYDGTAGGWSGEAVITVAESPANSPPTVDAGTNQTVNEGDDVTLSGVAADPGGGPLTYSWTHARSDLGISLDDPAALSTTFTAPQVDSDGSIITLTLAVTDSHGATASDTMTVTVLDVPDSNTVVLEPGGPLGPRDIGRITLNGATPGTIHATWEEPDTDPANYRVSWAKTGENFLTFTDLSGNAFPTEPSYTITNLEEGGQYKVKILASYDGTAGGWSGEAVITVAESPANSPPTVDAGTNQTVNEGDDVPLSGVAADPDDDPLTYSWTHARSDLGISLDDPAVLSTTFTAPQVDSDGSIITLTLAVTDSHGATASDTMTVTVLDVPDSNTVVLEPGGPLGPRDIGRITLNGATPGTIHATWEEPDTNPANYRVSWAKTGENFLTFTDLSGNAFPTEPSYTITNLEEGGQYKVKILASYDGTAGGWSGEAVITVAESPANSPPTVDAGTNQTVNEGDDVPLSGVAADPDDDPLTYSWTHARSDLGISLDDPAALSTTFTAPQVDSDGSIITLTLAVTDSHGATASDTMTVTVLDVPDSNTVVLEPGGPLGPRDIGRITLNGATPGTIHATWEEPDTNPANYRVSWAKTGENFLTFTDLSGNAFPTEPSYTITNLEEGEQYKVKILASYDGTAGGWSGEAVITVAESPANSQPTVDAGLIEEG